MANQDGAIEPKQLGESFIEFKVKYKDHKN